MQYKTKNTLVAIMLSCILNIPNTAFSQNEDYFFNPDFFIDDIGEEVISIAAGRNQYISEAPAVAAVITSDDIRDIGATNLSEVLETIPGIHISNSQIRLKSIALFRGIYTNINPHILVMLNSVPITHAFFGDRTSSLRSAIPIESVDRIEVVRGPGSAIYGADAFAGVVNIITKSAGDINGVEGGVRYGSFNTKNAWALYGGEWGDLNAAFTFEHNYTSGDDGRIISADSQTLFDNVFGTNASHAPGPVTTNEKRTDIHFELNYNEWTFRGWSWWQHEGGVGVGVGTALDPTGHTQVDSHLFSLTFDDPYFAKDWEVKSTMSYNILGGETWQKIFPSNTILPIGSDGNVDINNPSGLVLFPDGMIGNPGLSERHYRFDISTFYTGIEDHILRMSTGVHHINSKANETKNFGRGVLDGDALEPPPTINVSDVPVTDVTDTPYIYLKPSTRTDYHISIQDEWFFHTDWSLTTGLRYDHYSDFGDTFNPRIALVWETTHDLTTKLLYGRAFRPPSFSELLNDNNPVFEGNPDLDPEIINTMELAFDYRPTFDIRTGLNLFAYKIDDLIEYVPNETNTVSIAQNVGNQKGYGLELTGEWDILPTLTLQGNYAYQHSIDPDTDHSAGHAPQNRIYLMSKWEFKPTWFFNTQLHWVGNRKRVFGDTRPEIDDYTIVNVALRKKNITKNISAAVLIDNIFNTSAFEPSPINTIPGDYPLEGRSVMGELRFQF